MIDRVKRGAPQALYGNFEYALMELASADLCPANIYLYIANCEF